MTDKALDGRKILVVEDEYFQAREMKALLERQGATVVGPVSRASEAEALLIEQPVDAAVLDINLGGGPNFATANLLQREGVPFAIVTGYEKSAIPAELSAVPRLDKPASEKALIAQLAQLV